MLGVAIIAAVGSLSAAVVAGIAADARSILGGDLDIRLIHREADAAQRTAFAAAEGVSVVREMRAMARPAAGDSAERVLVELKAVDETYPLYGAVRLAPEMPLAEALAGRADSADGPRWGAVADPAE